MQWLKIYILGVLVLSSLTWTDAFRFQRTHWYRVSMRPKSIVSQNSRNREACKIVELSNVMEQIGSTGNVSVRTGGREEFVILMPMYATSKMDNLNTSIQGCNNAAYDLYGCECNRIYKTLNNFKEYNSTNTSSLDGATETRVPFIKRSTYEMLIRGLMEAVIQYMNNISELPLFVHDRSRFLVFLCNHKL